MTKPCEVPRKAEVIGVPELLSKLLTFPLPNRKMMITCTSALCENERCGQSILALLLLSSSLEKNFPSTLMDLENLVAMISANLWNKTVATVR